MDSVSSVSDLDTLMVQDDMYMPKGTAAAYKAWETRRDKPLPTLELEKTPVQRALADTIKELRRNNG
jgi:hypothetical protein